MTFRILALSGGGFLGLFSVRILARMEEAIGRPIAQSFDLLCGTSAGAITALGLSLQQLTAVFLRHQLGERYLRVDSLRSSGLEADLAFDGATPNGVKTIFGLADHAFEEAMKQDRVRAMLDSFARPATFHAERPGDMRGAAI